MQSIHKISPSNAQSSRTIFGTTQRRLRFVRLTLVFFALLNVAAHLYASPGSTPIVSYWIDIETATYGLIAAVYLVGLRRYYVLPILFTAYNMTMYFLSGLVALPFGIDPKPLIGHVQFGLYSFGRGMLFWLTPFVYGLAKPVVISSSLIPRLHWWSGNSPNGILSIR